MERAGQCATLLAAVAVVGMFGATCVGASAAAAPRPVDQVPYTDPNAMGFIGLCDAADHSIDHGRIGDQPFVRSAVSSVAATAPYDGQGRTATLFAYQPREGTSPGEWSGQLLTASSRYDEPQHPTAVATPADDSLATFIDTFPPQWDGMIELRLFLGVAGVPTRTQQYAATDIRVDGDTWTVVRGGKAPCDASAATSLEVLLPGPTTGTADPAGTDPAIVGVPGTVPAAQRDDSGMASGTKVAIAAVLLLLAAGTVVGVGRSRRAKESAT